jgi:alpha-tubulin suppressor-like RCC1 family protein
MNRVSKVVLKLLSALFVAALLSGCGGEGSKPNTDDDTSLALIPEKVTVNVPNDSGASVEMTFEKVSENRAGRSIYEYEFSVTKSGKSEDPTLISFRTPQAATSLIDAGAYFLSGSARAVNTIILKHDRKESLSFTNWVHTASPFRPFSNIDATVASTKVKAGWKQNVSAIVGFQTDLSLVYKITDSDLSFREIRLVNETQGGGVPSPLIGSVATWRPSKADVVTTELVAIFVLSDGTEARTRLPVVVSSEQFFSRINLEEGRNTYSEKAGSIVFTVIGEISPGDYVEVFERVWPDGSLTHRITTSKDELQIEFVQAPSQRGGGLKFSSKKPNLKDKEYRSKEEQKELTKSTNDFGINQNGMILAGFPGSIATSRSELVTFYDAVSLVPGYRESKVEQVFQVDATCGSFRSCLTTSESGNPIILIHGFTPFGLGGGAGTWNDLAQRLYGAAGSRREARHDVFEFRWHTSMRFEEAAGALSAVVERVVKMTGRKPIILAHSFGGIVSHLALAGRGVVWRGEWKLVPSASINVSHLVTMGSPISGIADQVASITSTEYQEMIQFRVGRDREITINGCGEVTCIQAGATDVETFNSVQRRVKAIGSLPGSSVALEVGESIFRIKNSPHATPTAIVVGAVPGARGDRLISLDGQVHPLDPVQPVANLLDPKASSRDMPSHEVSTRRYFLLNHGVHTNDVFTRHKRNSSDIPEPFVSDDRVSCDFASMPTANGSLLSTGVGASNAGLSGQMVCIPVAHHLVTANWDSYRSDGFRGIFRKPVVIVESAPAVKRYEMRALVNRVDSFGKALRVPVSQKTSLVGAMVKAEVREKGTGSLIASVIEYTDINGIAAIDLTSIIGNAPTFDRSSVYARVVAGDGVAYAPFIAFADDLTADVTDLDIDLVPVVPVGQQGAIDGLVVDTAGRGVPNVRVWIRAGSNLGVGQFENIPDSSTSRTVTTDASGRFVAGALNPGQYSVMTRSATTRQAFAGGIVVSPSATASPVVPVLATFCPEGLTLRSGGCFGGSAPIAVACPAGQIALLDGRCVVGPQTQPDAPPAPPPSVVELISPLDAVAGVPRTFTVQGRGLPQVLAFNLPGCSNVTEVLVGSSSTQRQFTCVFQASTVPGSYPGTIATSSSPFGPPPLFTFNVNVTAPPLVASAVSPTRVIRTVATSLVISGQNLPTGGAVALAPAAGGDARSSCAIPSSRSATSLTVTCTLYRVGPQVLELRDGAAVVRTLSVDVGSNVSGVSWTSASTASSGTVRFGESVNYTVRGQNLLADPVMGFAVERCGVSNTEVGTPSATSRSFTCWFNNEAGALAGPMTGVVKDSPSGQSLYDFSVPLASVPIDPNNSVVVSWDRGSVGTALTGRGTNPRTVAITGGVELEGFIDGPAFDVDVSTDRVRLFNFRSYPGAPRSAVFDGSAFNGLVLRPPSGANWVFGGASVGAANNLSDLTNARLSTPGGAGGWLAVNLSGMSYSTTTAVEVVFQRDVAPQGVSGLSTRVAAGYVHTAALRSDGSLWAWGLNDFGQLGDGTISASLVPKEIGTGYSAISAGYAHTVALRSDGSLWAWGWNLYGQLGDGTTSNSLAPKQIGTGYSAISAGYAHTVALRTDGSLWAWGWNGYEQLGDGTLSSSLVPKLIGTGYAAIAVGDFHTVALRSDGSLWAWGANELGQLGDGTTSISSVPKEIGTGYSAIAAGYAHTAAIRSDGSLWAWGWNVYGQLGDGTRSVSLVPKQIGTGYSAIAAGDVHTVALRSNGNLWAWGLNGNGQLGDGTTSVSLVPKQIGTGYSAISAGSAHTIALRSDGSLWAWGYNYYGQLGDGTSSDSLVPKQIGTGFGP